MSSQQNKKTSDFQIVGGNGITLFFFDYIIYAGFSAFLISRYVTSVQAPS